MPATNPELLGGAKPEGVILSIEIQRTNGILHELSIKGGSNGPLAKLTFVAKDLYDVAGHTTGAGNPDWLRTHEAAAKNAVVIDQFLDAGATLTGKTVTDEIAYSVDGVNVHYGAPENPQYPGRTAGGSSSGSASAVAAKLADFALGSDTAGSVRIPASFCGIYGFRPTFGRISLEGVVPLAPVFDTVGWLARDPHVLTLCGEVLLKEKAVGKPFKKLLVATDAFEFINPILGAALAEALTCVRKSFDSAEGTDLTAFGWNDYLGYFRIIQSFSAWKTHGDWVTSVKPKFDDSIQERFDFARDVTEEQNAAATAERTKIIEHFQKMLAGDTVLCMPTTWDLPPQVDATPNEFLHERLANIGLTCVSPLACVPQVTVPIRYSNTATTGLSFIAGQNEDLNLLQLCEQLSESFRKFESEKYPQAVCTK